jgi:hypothetical protein
MRSGVPRACRAFANTSNDGPYRRAWGISPRLARGLRADAAAHFPMGFRVTSGASLSIQSLRPEFTGA